MANQKKHKKSLYKINDSFFRFYFRYILPNKSRIELGIKQPVIQIFLNDQNKFVAQVWEDLTRKAVPFLNVENIQWDIASRWWGNGIDRKQMEIDVVAESIDKKRLLVGEVKWSKNENPDALLENLREKAMKAPFAQKKKIIPVLFLKSNNNYKKANTYTPVEVMQALK
ncbi:MAG: DUF234 domain-containing protein [Bacteroidales bacterium]|nr:DUF234 domain-containing protein [Bacteroidales bacterium]